MADALWVVRAGKGAAYAQDFLAGSYVAVAFSEVAQDDLRGVSAEDLAARATNGPQQAFTRQLNAFARKIDDGDLVIVPRLTKAHRDYLVGRVGPYQHDPAGLPSGNHRRPVEWLGRIARDSISEAARNTLGAILTVFRPSAVEAELRGLMTAMLPIEEGGREPVTHRSSPVEVSEQNRAPVAVAPAERSLAPVQLDIAVDEAGRARITCAHPALVMEQTPRHVGPAAEWRGVPGIYVLSGSTLEQSSSWTGNERTLTTTSIVRPWAYVGLSEDFLGRISSHRSAKPEWRRALLVRSGAQPFTGDDIRFLELAVHSLLDATGEVVLGQSTPRGNVSAVPRHPQMLDACAETVIAVLRLTGILI